MTWLPEEFAHPERLDLTTGHHLRPIRADDVDIDYPAVMGSREHLWAQYGEAWGWPPADMTLAADRKDLAHHERENAAQATFCYAVLPADERELVGCVYLDPPYGPAPPGTDAMASWWVVEREAGGPLERALDEAIPRWLGDRWGFRSVHFFP